MLQPDAPTGTVARLVQRARSLARATSWNRQRSAQLVARAALICEQAATGRAERRRTTARSWLPDIRPLPLTPPMLLELANEFRVLAENASTPDSSLAFHNLAFRYTALAGGYDTQAMPSRMLH
jgi:hypothetical protein